MHLWNTGIHELLLIWCNRSSGGSSSKSSSGASRRSWRQADRYRGRWVDRDRGRWVRGRRVDRDRGRRARDWLGPSGRARGRASYESAMGWNLGRQGLILRAWLERGGGRRCPWRWRRRATVRGTLARREEEERLWSGCGDGITVRESSGSCGKLGYRSFPPLWRNGWSQLCRKTA